MNTATVNVNTDPEVMDAAKKIFEHLGLTLSGAVNLFLLETVRENDMPFAWEPDIPNDATAAAIEEGRRMAYDKTSKGYRSMEELRKALEV